MRTTGVAIVTLQLVVLSCGPSGHPTSPGLVATAATASGLAPAAVRSDQTGVLSGRVTNGVTGESVSRARVELEGVGNVTTRGDGSFAIEAPVLTSGAIPLRIDADAFWSRQTQVSTSSALSVDVTLFPSTDPFDLGFFDHVFRDMGERGTRPWSFQPVFEIWTKVFDCSDLGEGGVCDELEATAQNVPAKFLQLARDVIENDVPRYTGGAIDGLSVTERAHEPGERIPVELQAEIGKITIALVKFPHRTSWARYWNFKRGNKSRGHIQINKRHKALRGVYSHEFAHTLGFRHPIGAENVPLPSIMRRGHGPEPTRHDILHGRLMYARPPDSMSPDRDPAGFVINALRPLIGAAGQEEVATVDP